MKTERYDAIVVGCGAAGMAAATELQNRGFDTAVIEREEQPGGILLQCIHNGFGLHNFKEELTGPEYAERFIARLAQSGAKVYCNSTAVSLGNENGLKKVVVYSAEHGVMSVEGKAVILAMGCRERNRGNVSIPGSRPAGIFTAGLAQRLVNIEGLLPGKRVVIVGSGDIGLIMARRMTWAGAEVLAVVEILPHPSGLARNIVQCLNDFDIPLYLSHCISRIDGRDRVERVEVSPLKDGAPDLEKSFNIDCDTVLLSVGLIPENEISQAAGVSICPDTNGPYVNGELMTGIDGVFACGNVLHVHDVVDFVTQEAEYCGRCVSDYLEGRTPLKEVPAIAGKNIRYVMPQKFDPSKENVFSIRPLIIEKNVDCIVRRGETVIMRKKLRHVLPAEMIRISLLPEDDADPEEPLEISLEHQK